MHSNHTHHFSVKLIFSSKFYTHSEKVGDQISISAIGIPHQQTCLVWVITIDWDPKWTTDGLEKYKCLQNNSLDLSLLIGTNEKVQSRSDLLNWWRLPLLFHTEQSGRSQFYSLDKRMDQHWGTGWEARELFWIPLLKRYHFLLFFLSVCFH